MQTTQYETEAWSLDELFAGFDDPAIAAEMAQIETMVQQIEQYREQLTADISADAFLNIIGDYESLLKKLYRLFGFGSLSFSSDTQDQRAQTFMAQISQTGAQLQNRMLFFSIWWKELDGDNAERLLQASGEWRYWLEQMRLQKPFTLSEVEEQVINLKDVNGVQALTRLFSAITNRYTFTIEVDGEEKQLTREQLGVYMRSTDPDVRRRAYEEQLRVFGDDASILGQIYQAIVRDWRSEYVDMRGYASPIAVRNRVNDIPSEVVETLLSVVRHNAPLFHRYFALKARWLGMPKLRRYDLYAPVASSSKKYSFNEAVNLVIDGFEEFDMEVAGFARQVLDQKHYDSETRPGKRSGAFCAPISPDYTPWVSQSFQGEPRDVATMAHELGHAVHALLASDNSILTYRSSLTLAETASTFGEMLLLDKMLAADPDPELQHDLLFGSMDDAYATITRQGYFAIFEIEAHEAIANGASIDDLGDLSLKILREQFGDAIDLSDDFRDEWVGVPHFYGSPFYVYAYAFGQLLAMSLYQQYRMQGSAMIPRYLDILRAGGSASPIDILQRAGIDVYSADFWQSGFDIIAERLQQLESLPLPRRLRESKNGVH